MSGGSSPSWSSERLTPRQFVERYSLPRLARLAAGAGGDIPAQPLLLYCQYRSGKVQARCLASTKGHTPQGPAVVIPDSYTGQLPQLFGPPPFLHADTINLPIVLFISLYHLKYKITKLLNSI